MSKFNSFNDILDLQSDESTQETHLKEKKESPRTSNGFYQDFLRLDLLTRTTKGVFPDIVPDGNFLKNFFENFHKEQGAVPVRIS